MKSKIAEKGYIDEPIDSNIDLPKAIRNMC